jgi:hypothetical protein
MNGLSILSSHCSEGREVIRNNTFVWYFVSGTRESHTGRNDASKVDVPVLAGLFFNQKYSAESAVRKGALS